VLDTLLGGIIWTKKQNYAF